MIPTKLLILVATYAALFCFTPILGAKVVSLGWGIQMLGGTIAGTLAAGFLDTIHQVYGTDTAKKSLIAAVTARVMVWAAVLIVVLLPAASVHPGFYAVLKISFRVFIAGEIAQFVSNYFFDIPIFKWVRAKLNGRGGFAGAYNLSNLVSVGFSNVIFTTVAMYGVKPVLPIIAGGLMVKMGGSFLLTPLFALLVKWATPKE